jgi:hypothetical protein
MTPKQNIVFAYLACAMLHAGAILALTWTSHNGLIVT